jgi:hypothetical protein
MTRDDFINLIDNASSLAVQFARRYVQNTLPDVYRYHILLNQSYDGHATADEVIYPEDDRREFKFDSREKVADLLVREDRCPEWIDISVEAAGTDHTVLRLLCCGRYHADIDRMYYNFQGTGPFGIKSPDLPPGYIEGSIFDIPTVRESSWLRRICKRRSLT